MKKYIIALVVLLSTAGSVAQNTTKTTLKLQGIEMTEAMNEDGSAIIQRPYRWFAGIATADLQSMAVEMAQLEAYATISRVIENIVTSNAERRSIVMDSKVQMALQSQWKQMSNSIQKACEPYGETEVTFNSDTGMYEAIAKVGIRGDRYVKLLDEAKKVKPNGLTGENLKQFIDANNAIIDAAKGN